MTTLSINLNIDKEERIGITGFDKANRITFFLIVFDILNP